MRTRLRGKVTLLFVAFAVAMLAFPVIAFAQDAGGTAAAPTIQSDQADYAPGDTVTLTGSGWQPQESVDIVVNDDQGQTWSHTATVTADDNGNFTHQLQLPSSFVAVYKVTATGATSGTATTTFTDANVRFLSSGPTLSSIAWQKYSNASCTTAISGSGNSGTGNITSTDSQTGTLNVEAGTTNTYVGLTAPATAGGKNFVNWTRTSGNNAFTVSGTDNRTICVQGDTSGGTVRYTATYGTPVVTIDSTSPQVLGSSGSSTITWHADSNGTFSVRIGGTDCSTGTQVGGSSGSGGSGNYSTQPNTTTATVNASALSVGPNTIRVCVTTAAGKNAAGTDVAGITGSATTTVTKDLTPPTVSSINRFAPADSHTNTTGNVLWTVTFSENVSGVDTGDFQLANPGGGISGAVVTGVTPASGPSATYTVSVHPGGGGEGTLRLDLVDNDSIVDEATNKLGGTGTTTTGNGSFTTGETYTFDYTRPTVTEVVPTEDANNVAVGTNVTAKFSEDMKASTINSSNFHLRLGTLGGSVVSGSGVNYVSSSRTATLDPFANDPSANLLYAQEYTALLNNEVRDLAGNRLMTCLRCPLNPPLEGKWWSFTTEPPPDAVDPTTAVSAKKATTPTPSDYFSGEWSNKNVTVNLSASDNDGGSGVKNLVYSATGADPIDPAVTDTTAPFEASLVIDDEGVTTISFHAEDKNGNVEDTQTFVVKLDKTAPAITAHTFKDGAAATSNTISPNAAGWFNATTGRPTAHFTCSDPAAANGSAGSGLATNACPAPHAFTSDGANQSSGPKTVTDLAGNVSAEHNVTGVNIDTVAPSILDRGPRTATDAVDAPTGTDNSDPQNVVEWYNHNITNVFRASDATPGSGFASPTTNPHDISKQITAEGRGLTVASGTVTDVAGNQADSVQSADFNIDKKAPSAPTANYRTPEDIVGQWFKDSVTVKYDGSTDPLLADGSNGSGVKSYSEDDVLSDAGSNSYSGTATDYAGNESVATTGSLKVDKDAPSVQFTNCPTTPLLKDTTYNANWTASDPGAPTTGSGLKGSATGSVPLITNTVTLPTRTASVQAEDKVGHTTTANCTYEVDFSFTGFFSPVDGGTTYNTVKAGQAIPIKFNLGGNQGLDIFYVATASDTYKGNYPLSAKVPCNATSPQDMIEETVTAGQSSLTYDTSANQYVYVWKTDKSYAGTCRQFQMKLADGTMRTALFNFTR